MEAYKTELIDGKELMLASPTTTHGAIVGTLHSIINLNLGKGCTVFTDCVDVVCDEKNIFVPDITVVKNKDIHNEKVVGTPKLVIEVWSLGNKQAERQKKKQLYAIKGIPQFIEIDYLRREVVSNSLVDGGYQTTKKVEVYPIYEYENANMVDEIDHVIFVDCVGIEVDMLDVFSGEILKYVPR
ncbi:MAG: hypothetical protein ATN35_06110 [Epulopiscium sp. Nele67-Bin004]|nr:MAG: hypothetical protein ATN35_06110 [Epulopiscium sp. Nele67-Bin004]